MRLRFQSATAGDAVALAELHTATAEHLTGLHGIGPWSGKTSEKGVLFAMRTSQVFVAREGSEIVATLRLVTKKPWAIDPSYFTVFKKPLYLAAMAVLPERQGRGIGKWCLEQAALVAREWPADVIRLDAYDAEAGAGGFYAKCGYAERGRVVYRNAPLIYFEQRVVS